MEWFFWFVLIIMLWLAVRIIEGFYVVCKRGLFYRITPVKKTFFMLIEILFSFCFILGFVYGVPWAVFFLVLGILWGIWVFFRIYDIKKGTTRIFMTPVAAAINIAVDTVFLFLSVLYLFSFNLH